MRCLTGERGLLFDGTLFFFLFFLIPFLCLLLFIGWVNGLVVYDLPSRRQDSDWGKSENESGGEEEARVLKRTCHLRSHLSFHQMRFADGTKSKSDLYVEFWTLLSCSKNFLHSSEKRIFLRIVIGVSQSFGSSVTYWTGLEPTSLSECFAR